MNKKIQGLTIAFFVFYIGSAKSIVTSDPTSYTYMIEQINQYTKMIENTTKTVKTGAGTLTAIQAVKSAATGSYNRAMRALDNAKRATENLAETKPIIDEVLDVQNTQYASVSDYKKWFGEDKYKLYKDSESVLDRIFSDPRDRTEDQQTKLILDQVRQNIRQKSIKNTIDTAQAIMKTQKERLKNLEEMAELIDNTENTKDALDLNNRFLFELVRLNVELLTVVVSLSESVSLNQYQGYNKERAKIDSQKLKKIEKKEYTPAFKKFHKDAQHIKIKGLDY